VALFVVRGLFGWWVAPSGVGGWHRLGSTVWAPIERSRLVGGTVWGVELGGWHRSGRSGFLVPEPSR
jgi:hypothetical protein